MTNYIYIAQSLDGYIADQAGGLDWLNEIPNPEGSDFGFGEFMAGIDALVMGRKTFETVLGLGGWIYDKPVYVISSTLTSLPEEYQDKSCLLDLPPAGILSCLNTQGLVNLYIDGGTLIQSFLTEDLIDEMIITTVPILLGGGVHLFRELDQQLRFKLRSSKVISEGLVINHYQRFRTP